MPLSSGGHNLNTLYFYDYETKKDVDKILKEDLFKRLGYTIRECKLMGPEREGYYLYIKSAPEMIKKVDEAFEGTKIEKVTGKEAEDVIEKIKADDEAAATGMGMIFG
jgi:hypothetical protein